jgi:hypothetical protein
MNKFNFDGKKIREGLGRNLSFCEKNSESYVVVDMVTENKIMPKGHLSIVNITSKMCSKILEGSPKRIKIEFGKDEIGINECLVLMGPQDQVLTEGGILECDDEGKLRSYAASLSKKEEALVEAFFKNEKRNF